MKANGGGRPALILGIFFVAGGALGCVRALRAVEWDLYAAAKRNDVADAQQLLAAGANVNAKNEGFFEGLPPLAWAAAWGSVETTDVLIAHGADINGANRHGTTPLHFAAFYEEPATVALLIRRGAAVNARDRLGWTALFKAMERLALVPVTEMAEEREVAKVGAVVSLLLASGAQIAVPDSHGIAPIHLAALTRQTTLVQMLLDKGVGVDAPGPDEMTPLFLASKTDAVGVARLLLTRGADVDARTRNGNTPLSVAATEGNLAVANLLLSQRATVDARSDDGATPLLLASRSLLIRYTFQAPTSSAEAVRGAFAPREIEGVHLRMRYRKGQFDDVVRLLMDHGADPNIVAGEITPLRAAALAGDAALAGALIARGAAIDAAPTGETSLHGAIAEAHGDVAALLVENGANVNARDFNQRTPLHFLALFMHDRQMAELLIQHGADVNAKDKDGRTPLADAVGSVNREVAEALRRHGAL